MTSRKRIEEQLAKLKNDLAKKESKLKRNEAKTHVKKRLKELHLEGTERNPEETSSNVWTSYAKPSSGLPETDERQPSVTFSLDTNLVETQSRSSRKLESNIVCHSILKRNITQSEANTDSGESKISKNKKIQGSPHSLPKCEQKSVHIKKSKNVEISIDTNLMSQESIQHDENMGSENGNLESHSKSSIRSSPNTVSYVGNNSLKMIGRGNNLIFESQSHSPSSSISLSTQESEITYDSSAVICRKTKQNVPKLRRKSCVTKSSRRNSPSRSMASDLNVSSISVNLESQLSDDEFGIKSPTLPKFYDGLSQCGPNVGFCPLRSPTMKSENSIVNDDEMVPKNTIDKRTLKKCDRLRDRFSPTMPLVERSPPNKEANLNHKNSIFPTFPKSSHSTSNPQDVVHFSLPDAEYVQLKLDRLKRKLNISSSPVSPHPLNSQTEKSTDQRIAKLFKAQESNQNINRDQKSHQLGICDSGEFATGTRLLLDFNVSKNIDSESDRKLGDSTHHGTRSLSIQEESSQADTCSTQSLENSNQTDKGGDEQLDMYQNKLKVKRKRGRPRKRTSYKKKKVASVENENTKLSNVEASVNANIDKNLLENDNGIIKEKSLITSSVNKGLSLDNCSENLSIEGDNSTYTVSKGDPFNAHGSRCLSIMSDSQGKTTDTHSEIVQEQQLIDSKYCADKNETKAGCYDFHNSQKNRRGDTILLSTETFLKISNNFLSEKQRTNTCTSGDVCQERKTTASEIRTLTGSPENVEESSATDRRCNETLSADFNSSSSQNICTSELKIPRVTKHTNPETKLNEKADIIQNNKDVDTILVNEKDQVKSPKNLNRKSSPTCNELKIKTTGYLHDKKLLPMKDKSPSRDDLVTEEKVRTLLPDGPLFNISSEAVSKSQYDVFSYSLTGEVVTSPNDSMLEIIVLEDSKLSNVCEQPITNCEFSNCETVLPHGENKTKTCEVSKSDITDCVSNKNMIKENITQTEYLLNPTNCVSSQDNKVLVTASHKQECYEMNGDWYDRSNAANQSTLVLDISTHDRHDNNDKIQYHENEEEIKCTNRESNIQTLLSSSDIEYENPHHVNDGSVFDSCVQSGYLEDYQENEVDATLLVNSSSFAERDHLDCKPPITFKNCLKHTTPFPILSLACCSLEMEDTSLLIVAVCTKNAVSLWEEKSHAHWDHLSSWHADKNESFSCVELIEGQSCVALLIRAEVDHMVSLQLKVCLLLSQTESSVSYSEKSSTLSLQPCGECTLAKSNSDWSDLLACPVSDYGLCIAWSSADSTHLTKHHLGADLMGFTRTTQLDSVGTRINYIVKVTGLTSAILGASKHQLHIWNHDKGFLLKVIDIVPDLKITNCLSAVAESGLVFVALLHTSGGGVFLWNPSCDKMNMIYTFQGIEKDTIIATGSSTCCGYSSSLDSSGVLSVWNVFSGHLISKLSCQPKHNNISTACLHEAHLLTGTKSGCVHKYEFVFN